MKARQALGGAIQRASSWIDGCHACMKSVPQIRTGIVGEFPPTFEPRTATSAAVDHAHSGLPV
jgi:hypothetical protein